MELDRVENNYATNQAMTSINIELDRLGPARGKVVLITGGASGIGRAAAELFHSLGALVVVGDLNERLGNEMESTFQTNFIFQVCNVAKWDSLQELFETATREFGRVDIVLANAGAEVEDVFNNVIDDLTGELREPKYIVLDIDLKGVINTVKLAKYHFEKQKSPGAIVMTSSTAGVVGGTYLPMYTVSKHGVIGLMRAVSERSPFSENEIRVNCVAPFLTESGFITEGMRSQLEGLKLPLNKASSVAKAMAYLSLTAGITGQTIYVADDEFTELESPIRALRSQWLGEKNSSLLSPIGNSGLLVNQSNP